MKVNFVENPMFDVVQEARKIFLEMWRKYWLENALFTWQWWFLLITVIFTLASMVESR